MPLGNEETYPTNPTKREVLKIIIFKSSKRQEGYVSCLEAIPSEGLADFHREKST